MADEQPHVVPIPPDVFERPVTRIDGTPPAPGTTPTAPTGPALPRPVTGRLGDESLGTDLQRAQLEEHAEPDGAAAVEERAAVHDAALHGSAIARAIEDADAQRANGAATEAQRQRESTSTRGLATPPTRSEQPVTEPVVDDASARRALGQLPAPVSVQQPNGTDVEHAAPVLPAPTAGAAAAVAAAAEAAPDVAPAPRPAAAPDAASAATPDATAITGERHVSPFDDAVVDGEAAARMVAAAGAPPQGVGTPPAPSIVGGDPPSASDIPAPDSMAQILGGAAASAHSGQASPIQRTSPATEHVTELDDLEERKKDIVGEDEDELRRQLRENERRAGRRRRER